MRIACLYLLALVLGGCAPYGGRDFAAAPAEARTVEVGILLRRQFTRDVAKLSHYRHVHAVLADGAVVSYNSTDYDAPLWKGILFYAPGEVQTTPDLRRVRPHYVSPAVARSCEYKGRPGYKMVTDWVRFKVTPEQAAALSEAWSDLAAGPPAFRLAGNNCSTRAYECFRRAGILPGGIPGIDRPENMMGPLRRYYPDLTVETGWFGIDDADRPYIEPLD